MTLWLLVLLAAMAIFALYKLFIKRKQERDQALRDSATHRTWQKRFDQTSRYAWQLRHLSEQYPDINHHPQIVENVSVKDRHALDHFDFRRHLISMMSDYARYENAIRTAARLSVQQTRFSEALKDIRETTRMEASALNIPAEECHKFEKILCGQYLGSALYPFVTCYVTSEQDDGERTFTMTFVEFRALCQSEKKLRKIESDIHAEIDKEKSARQRYAADVFSKAEGFMSVDDFDAAYKQNYDHDRPGVYIILIYDPALDNHSYSDWSDIYVGQSLTVYHRVRQHFTGHGNGDVYADIKYGKEAYVKLVFCEESQLNDLEKKYIADYNATDSYNNTKGGAAVRG